MNNLKESRNQGETPAAKSLDEAEWQEWPTKGRVNDRRSSAARVKAIQWASIAALLAAAGLWSRLGWFEFVARLVVTSGALVVMFQVLRARYHAVAAVFGALALLYNPVAPVFSFSGGWERALVLGSVALFAASLAWSHDRDARMAHNG